jgi:predicted SprT family Zn-dependent metalloprotease
MNENNEKMRATVEWLAKKYNEMNSLLFNNRLGECDFNIFTSGSGSQGRTLGRFRLSGRDLKYNTYNRRMYRESMFTGERTFVDKGNFYAICHPVIELNGNYTGTEEALLSTLVHEMCHYYTYMDGRIPKQAHGSEFRYIAEIVSARSKGRFSITRLASAEEMADYELDDEIKKKRERRLQNKMAKMSAVIVFPQVGPIELTMATNANLISEIVEINKKNNGEDRRGKIIEKVVVSNDPRLIEMLCEKGYSSVSRTYRYYEIDSSELGGRDFLDKNGYEYNVVFERSMRRNSPPEQNQAMHGMAEGRMARLADMIVERTMRRIRRDVSKIGVIEPNMNLGMESPDEV